jgi:hypothetical protein
VQNTGQFARAIATHLEQAAEWRRTPAAEQLVKFHSPQNFTATFSARLCERMGRPTLPGLVTWDDLQRLVSEVDR